MTILFFARRFYPLIGGVEKHVFEISQRLIKKGHRVIVITEHSSKLQKYEKLHPYGLEVYRIIVGDENRAKKFKIWNELWKLKEIIRQADVVHCHDVFYWYLPFRFIYPKKPVYMTFHGYEGYPVSEKAKRVRKISEKLSWGNICIGDFIKKWYGTQPTYVSYGGVNTSAMNQASNIKKDSAVFIGRLDDHTGILEYLKVYKLILKNYPNFELSVVGDGKYRSKIKNGIKVSGFQKDPEKYYIPNRFAFVSGYLSILEAMAAKRLVFSIYESPLKEDYLKMAPFAKYINISNNPEDIAKKIDYFFKYSNEEKKLVDKAFSWVKKQTWDGMVNIYLKLWNFA